jgi:hypothetical protein
MAKGTLIGESPRVGESLEGVGLRVAKVFRVKAGDEQPDQPLIWTFIEFEVPDSDAEKLASALRDVLDPQFGWYCDFRSVDNAFVVFSGRVFRYRRGDEAGRAEAEGYARSVGVPVTQIDWPE